MFRTSDAMAKTVHVTWGLWHLYSVAVIGIRKIKWEGLETANHSKTPPTKLYYEANLCFTHMHFLLQQLV